MTTTRDPSQFEIKILFVKGLGYRPSISFDGDEVYCGEYRDTIDEAYGRSRSKLQLILGGRIPQKEA